MTADAPLFTLVVPLTEPLIDPLVETVDAVLAQTFGDWELILVDNGSTSAEVSSALRRQAGRDSRIRVLARAERGNVAEASNDGLDAAQGEFIAFLAPGGLLTPNALAANARAIGNAHDVDFLYSDETRRTLDGDDDIIKPVWSPERLRAQNYCGQLAVLRTDLVRSVGRLRTDLGSSCDHDLVLRVTEQARRIVHLPKILHRSRIARPRPDTSPEALATGARVVQEHLDRVGIRGVAHAVGANHVRIVRDFPAERTVSVVIPTRGSSAQVWGRRRVLVVDAVRSVLEFAYHPRMEIVVVYDVGTPASVLEELRQVAGDHLVLVRFDEPFNYSRKMNRGVLASTGERLILLNDDVEVRNPGWVRELLAPLEEPGVGATGAKLYFEDTSIQHAGLAWVNRNWDHPYRLFPGDTAGRGRMNVVNREVSGVTGACTGIRRDTYFEVGGLTEQLPLNFNDVDFCYKITARGYRILYMAQCELFHFESRTRERRVHKYERDFIVSRWGGPDRDPYSPDYPEQPLTPADARRRAHEREEKAWARTLRARRAAARRTGGSRAGDRRA
ncbi:MULTISPECIES: glycosyltransferase [unclassified Nocardioides]|uniref:glycosyltransferase family 2 protein n=1 Tax=unclassified Nocardioides TaxID=2615069 RepID=UPI00114FC97D|nr:MULTISPECIES: glycosyltransferase [unclassified Nocardioides]TQK72248.1 GT2 family glycosyltransferase [Nocardioides sp. SLBN-35]WGY03540.1 glycosyltransferase [Nocardioides sp. QY071]